MAARKGDLTEQGRAIEAALGDLCGGWQVSAFGNPPCMPAVIARPIQGELSLPGEACQCQTVWLISAYAELCETDDTNPYEMIYDVMSGCNPCSIPRLIEAAQKTHFKGVARVSMRPASSFGFTSYNNNEANNAYAATVQVVMQYCCCDEKEETN